jgi:hypothetical protein
VNASDAATWFAAIIAAAGLVWTGISQGRERSARAQSESAEQAGRLLTLMREINLGGSDPALDPQVARKKHAAQLQDLQRVIRLGAADFVARSLKPPVSKTTITVVGGYSLILIVVGFFAVTAGGDSASERLGNLVSGAIYLTFGLGGAVLFARLLDGRKTHFAQLDAAAAERTEVVQARYERSAS